MGHVNGLAEQRQLAGCAGEALLRHAGPVGSAGDVSKTLFGWTVLDVEEGPRPHNPRCVISRFHFSNAGRRKDPSERESLPQVVIRHLCGTGSFFVFSLTGLGKTLLLLV